VTLPVPTLTGRLVRLEPLRLEHVPALARIGGADRETFGLTIVPSDQASAQAYVELALKEHAAGTVVPFATVRLADEQVVGTTRYLNIQHWSWPQGSPLTRRADQPDVVEIGATWLNPAVQRSGVNREAKLLMLSYAFETWQVHRVQLKTDARNTRSRNAILGIGARPDGIIRAERVAADGGIRDTAVFSIVQSEWPDVKRALQASLAR
jgi:RimJ/RimL family protein N-acetyltransferase